MTEVLQVKHSWTFFPHGFKVDYKQYSIYSLGVQGVFFVCYWKVVDLFLLFIKICNVSFIYKKKIKLWNTVKIYRILTFIFMLQEKV